MNTNQLERQLFKTQKMLKIFEKEKSAFQKQIQDLENQLEKQLNERKQTETQMDETKEKLKYLQSSFKYEEDQNIIQYDQLRLLYKAMISLQTRFQKQQELLERKNQELESFERSVYEYTQENREIKFQLQSITIELEDERKSNQQIQQNLQNQLDQCKLRLSSTLDALCEKENIIQELSQLWKNIEDLKPKLESIQNQEGKYLLPVVNEINTGDMLEICMEPLNIKIEELKNELYYLRNESNFKDQQINTLKEQLENIQNLPQAKIQKELVIQAIPKVLQEKIIIMQQSQNMLPQLTQKVVGLSQQLEEIEQNNKDLNIRMVEIQERSTKTEEGSQMLKLEVEELKTQKSYIIQNAEILLKQNWAMKNELLKLIGHDQTLKITKQQDFQIEGLDNLEQIIEENIKLKTQQYQRSTNWFKNQ